MVLIYNGTLKTVQVQNGMFQNCTLHNSMLQNCMFQNGKALQYGTWYKRVQLQKGTYDKMVHCYKMKH